MGNYLEDFAESHRTTLLGPNKYKDGEGKRYSAKHINAVGDENDTDIKGKGVGSEANADNPITTKGGDFVDRSERKTAISRNVAKFGYGPTSPYRTPDITNSGDGIIN